MSHTNWKPIQGVKRRRIMDSNEEIEYGSKDSRSQETNSAPNSYAHTKALLQEIQTFLQNENSGDPDASPEKARSISIKIIRLKYINIPWPKPHFKVGETVQVLAHNLEDLNLPLTLQFKINNPHNLQQYNKSMEDMQLFYGSWVAKYPKLNTTISMKIDDIREKKLYVGLIENVYKRVLVLQTPLPQDIFVHCYLPDEGTEAVISGSDFYVMARYFLQCPAQILEFQLKGMDTFLNSDEIVPQLSQLELTGDLTATILEIENPSVYTVTLHSPKYPGRSINDILLDRLLHAYDPRVKFPKEGCVLPRVYICHADFLGNVYLNLPNPVEDLLDDILQDISKEEFARKSGFETLPHRSTLCIARHEGEYFRVFCTDDFDDLIRVLTIDYGDEMKLDKSKIALADGFDPILRKIPPQAVIVHLANVAKMNGRKFFTAFRKAPAEMKVLRRTVSPSEIPEVELFQRYKDSKDSSKVSINHAVVHLLGIAKPVFPSMAIELSNIPQNFPISLKKMRQILPRGSDWGNGDDGIVQFKEGSVIDAIVTKIDSFGEMHIEPANFKVDISAEIARVRNQNWDPAHPNAIGPLRDDGQFVSYKKSVDGTYGRGLLLKKAMKNEKLDQESGKSRGCIFDVDLNKIVLAPVEDIQQLNTELERIPPQGARVFWVKPEYFGDKSEWDGFTKYAVGRCFQMLIISLKSDLPYGLQADVIFLSESGMPLIPKSGFWKMDAAELD